MSVIKLLENLLEYLDKAKEAELIEAVFHPALPPSQLDILQRKYQITLPTDLYEFYKACNGFTLSWKLSQSISDSDEEKILRRLQRLGIKVLNREDLLGSVNIIGLDQCLSKALINTVMSSNTNNMPFEFIDQSFTYASFSDRLRPFDRFDIKTDFSCAAFVFEGNPAKSTVMLLTDYYADWQQSRLSDFETYIRIIYASKAIPCIRLSLFDAYRGDKKPMMHFDETVKALVEFKF